MAGSEHTCVFSSRSSKLLKAFPVSHGINRRCCTYIAEVLHIQPTPAWRKVECIQTDAETDMCKAGISTPNVPDGPSGNERASGAGNRSPSRKDQGPTHGQADTSKEYSGLSA